MNMGITSLLSLLSFVPACRDCDFYDKVNYRYSSYFLIALGLTFFVREYFGNPIDCWQKPEWNPSWLQFAKDYCLVEGTYYIPEDQSYPKLQAHHNVTEYHKYSKINYYQWLPFTFCFIGLLLTLPQKYWEIVNWTSTLHMSSILTHVTKKNLKHPREFAKTVTCHMRDILKRNRVHHNPLIRLVHSMFLNRYLAVNHLFLKMLNFMTSMVAFYSLTYFVADNPNDHFGFTIFTNLLRGVDWRESEVFPRVVTCVFEIKEKAHNDLLMHNVIKTLPCVLSANMLTEFFYMISYVILLGVVLMNTYSFFLCCYQMTAKSRIRFIKNLLDNSVDFVWLLPHLDTKIAKEFEADEREFHKKDVAFKKVQHCSRRDVRDKAFAELERVTFDTQNKAAKRQAKRDRKRASYLADIDEHIQEFIDYLGEDSVLLLRLLMSNSTPCIAGALTGRLFWKFCKDLRTESDYHYARIDKGKKKHAKHV